MFAILGAEAAFLTGAASAALLFFWGDVLPADLGSAATVIGLFAWVFGVMSGAPSAWCATPTASPRCCASHTATIGLTVPAVLAIGLLSGKHVVLGVGSTEMLLLVLTLFLCGVTFGGARTNMLLGAVHLVAFLVYLVLIFSP